MYCEMHYRLNFNVRIGVNIMCTQSVKPTAKVRINSYLYRYKKIFQPIIYAINFLNINNKLILKGVQTNIGFALLQGLKIKNQGSGNVITIEDDARIQRSKITISGCNNSILIKKSAYLNEISISLENDGNEIIIGENTRLCGKTDIAAMEGTKVLIGDDCLFSGDLHFRTGDSHSLLDARGRINPSKDIVIDNHVWIGTKVTCLKGVHVSEGSVVAATTTLCKEYDEKNVLIAGVPGKVIRTGINWTKQRISAEIK